MHNKILYFTFILTHIYFYNEMETFKTEYFSNIFG